MSVGTIVGDLYGSFQCFYCPVLSICHYVGICRNVLTDRVVFGLEACVGMLDLLRCYVQFDTE